MTVHNFSTQDNTEQCCDNLPSYLQTNRSDVVYWRRRRHFSASNTYRCIAETNKKLSYRRETALQGGSVLAKSGRRYSADM